MGSTADGFTKLQTRILSTIRTVTPEMKKKAGNKTLFQTEEVEYGVKALVTRTE